jgi:PEP-CTERM motif
MRKNWIFAVGTLCLALGSSGQVKASIILTLEQVGNNVVGTATGSADTTDLNVFVNSGSATSAVLPDEADINIGSGDLNYYTALTGPSGFGGNVPTFANSSTGGVVSIGDYSGGQGVQEFLNLPVNYISETALSSTAVFDSTTLAAMSVTTGVYTWTWGSGPHADSVTLYAGVPVPASAPEPASFLLAGFGAAALRLAARRGTSGRK